MSYNGFGGMLNLAKSLKPVLHCKMRQDQCRYAALEDRLVWGHSIFFLPYPSLQSTIHSSPFASPPVRKAENIVAFFKDPYCRPEFQHISSEITLPLFLIQKL